MSGQYFVYILTNKNNTVLYTGVTRNLKMRVFEHKERWIEGFTKKYNVHKLVYFEIFQDAYNAIGREKKIKGGSRRNKMDLIASMNPFWDDLYDKL